MEGPARGLCEGQQDGVGAYVMAHLRYKQLYFLGMAYAMVRHHRTLAASFFSCVCWTREWEG